MMKSSKTIAAGLAAALLFAGLCGCQKEGPMERAGKQVDKAVGNAGKQIEKTGEKIQDVAKK